ncbi:unnamed protein product [Tuber melanosporum]|uniref:(Perigord truffle) hypothetical protein n=1 Tax=Tuber melanosporum (strain Mel28) TaxID=656061 RepID=D5GII9_TUBMM|nr:uncharacterized protein GSTUM_00008520001 [Tuber melanosporum]CAZ84332.1 unnamed protein product [Tuber melanosporum]
MTPPESGSPELRMARNFHEQQHGRSASTSLVATTETPKQTELGGSLVPALGQPPPQQAQRRPPNLLLKKNGKEAFKSFSYDMCSSSIPVSPPPSTPPPGSVQPSYLGTAQYPNNLLQQAQPDVSPSLRPGPPVKAQSFTTPLDTNVPPLTPAQQRLVGGRTPNGSPILPPLPSFQSGGFGFDNLDDPFSKPKPSPTYPGRSKYKPASFSAPPEPSENTSTPPSRWSRQAMPHQSQQVEEPQKSQESEANEVTPEPMSFHAITAEEPIVLPSSSETSPQPSPELNGAEFAEPPPKPQVNRKSNERGSFLGGWKLALINSRGASASPEDVKAASPDGDAPVGVGDGGGWIHRRKGSFSSTRPPSAEKSKYKQFGQEYKEFRAQKKAESAASSKRTSKQNSVPTSPIEGTGVSAILGGAGSSKDASGEKMKSSEARQIQRADESGVDANEIVGLDVAVRQMNLLERQLRSGQPLSPPDSRDGETRPVELDKGYLANSEQSRASSSLPSPTEGLKGQNPVPGPPPAHKKKESKGKSRSPLRHEIDSSSAPSSPSAPVPPSTGKGKGKEVGSKHAQEGSKGSSRHPADPQYPPPSEYLGQTKGSVAGAGSSSSAAGPSAPSKPVAKLFVICCRCKYWHDLPSIMYRAMVENGGATRCPYCLHGMEAACCSGYTCVVYMHQKHHGLGI